MGGENEMRVLISVVGTISIVAAPILFWVWYFHMRQDAQAPQKLKFGSLVLALLVTLFSAFLALADVPRVQTALASGRGIWFKLKVINWFFVIAFVLIALYFLRLYLHLTS
jgi:uncharacterized membrane protein